MQINHEQISWTGLVNSNACSILLAESFIVKQPKNILGIVVASIVLVVLVVIAIVQYAKEQEILMEQAQQAAQAQQAVQAQHGKEAAVAEERRVAEMRQQQEEAGRQRQQQGGEDAAAIKKRIDFARDLKIAYRWQGRDVDVYTTAYEETPSESPVPTEQRDRGNAKGLVLWDSSIPAKEFMLSFWRSSTTDGMLQNLNQLDFGKVEFVDGGTYCIIPLAGNSDIGMSFSKVGAMCWPVGRAEPKSVPGTGTP